ncbi:hypothetical protein AgCh_031325 [Apium graveolens]
MDEPWTSSADIPKASRRRFPVGFPLGLGIRNLSPLGQLMQKKGVVPLELLIGRKLVDHIMPQQQQSVVTWMGLFFSSTGTQPQLHLYSGEGSRTPSKEQPRHQELSFGARKMGSPSLGLGAPGFTFINKLFKESTYSNL